MKDRVGFASPMLVAAVVLAAMAPVTSLAMDQKTTTDRINQIKSMPKVERDRLDRNIAEFQTLSADQKQHYRALHDELVKDRMQSGGLSALMQTYSIWVQTLSPAQRDELQKETDPAKKLGLVRRYKEEQDRPKTNTETPHEEPIPAPSAKIPPKLALDTKDLAAVIKVLVEGLPASRMRPEFEASQVPLNLYLPIVEASAQSSGNFREWPDDMQLQKMIAAVRNKDSSTMITKSTTKRETVIRLMLMGVWKQVMDSVRFPNEDERRQIFEAMDPKEREKIIGHPQDEMTRMLTRKYFESKGDDSFTKIPDYRRRVIDLFERFDVPPPPRFAHPKPPRDRQMNSKL